MKTVDIMKELIREYYSKSDLVLPPDFYLREIAIQPFNLDTYIRHLSFSSLSEFKKFVIESTPRHLYYSSARYQEPANPLMDEKKWLGSDLVFDIDADGIPDCIESGKYIRVKFCKKCGYTTDQPETKTCPNCGSELKKFEHVDTTCITMAKEHVLKLLEVLKDDFGFSNPIIAFSGHRGFHVIVELDENYRYMTSDDRREITSYIRLDEQTIRFVIEEMIKSSKRLMPLPPRVTDGGIRRRIALSLTKYVDDNVKAYILGLKPALSFIEAQRIYNELSKYINDIIRSVSISIDLKVTIDVTHLVRIPNSINGKTGWRAVHIKDTNIDEFEVSPEELKALDSKIKVKFLISIPEIVVIDTQFRYNKDDEAILEYPYASYFVFKEVATAINIVR